MGIQLKLVPRSTLKLKSLVGISARVAGSGPITVTKANGTYTAALDITDLTPTSAAAVNDTSEIEFLAYDVVQQTFKKITLGNVFETLASDADPLMDGTADPGTSDLLARDDHIHPTDTSRLAASALDTDATFAADSDTKVPSQKAVKTALDLKAPLASPTFTGTPAAPTAVAGTNTTQIATTAFVTGAVSSKVGGPASSIDGGLVVFDGTTGKLLKSGIVEASDASLAVNFFSATGLDGQAAVAFKGSDAGSHSGDQHATVFIESHPTGSGAYGPGSGDVALGIAMWKANWLDSATAVQGEIDGLYIVTRNGGPLYTTTGTGGDIGNILVDCRILQGTGYSSMLEGNMSSVDATDTTQKSIAIQLGVLDTAAGGTPGTSIGYYAAPNTGTLENFLLTRSAAGTSVTNILNYGNENGDRFVITGNGGPKVLWYPVDGVSTNWIAAYNAGGDFVLVSSAGGVPFTLDSSTGDLNITGGYQQNGESLLAKFPGYVSGVFTTGRLAAMTSGATIALAANTLYAFPLILDADTTWTDIAFAVTATGTATNARLGIFSSSGGLPDALLLDAGTVAVGTTGTKTIAINQALDAGFYYAVIVCDGTVTVQGQAAGANADNTYASMVGSSSLNAAADQQLSRAFTYGALTGATPFGAPTRTAANFPVIALKC